MTPASVSLELVGWLVVGGVAAGFAIGHGVGFLRGWRRGWHAGELDTRRALERERLNGGAR